MGKTKSKKEDHKMKFHGFRSIAEYESECANIGFSTRRIPFHKGGRKYFVLITSSPKTPDGVDTWCLFTADETSEVMNGIISNGGRMAPKKHMRNGLDMDYLGKLAAHGYYPDSPEDGPTKPLSALTAFDFPIDANGQICFSF